MIILRQKEYSTPISRFLAGFNKNILRKPKIKAYRSAINKENSILNKVSKGLSLSRKGFYKPGSLINLGIQKTIENPVTTIGTVAGKVTDVTHPYTAVIPKATIATIIGNKILPKSIRNKLKKVSNNYTKTEVHKLIDKIPSIPDIAKIAEFTGKGAGII